MRFQDLQLNDSLLAAVAAEGYTEPTPIQQKAIPHVLEGRDLIGLAQTGTGKTAAFALPILHLLSKNPAPRRHTLRVLVLAPTRELASQIEQSFATYGRGSGFRQTVIFGGVGQGKQAQALHHGVDILVATPGRLLDLIGQGLAKLDTLEIVVLDEADRMLDMGFIHDVKKIIQKLPAKRQTLFFSATMPPEVKKLADGLLKNPVQVAVSPVSSTAERIEQAVYFVEKNDKRALLSHVLHDPNIRRALVFTRTKHGANRVAEYLSKGGVTAEAIHGNKSQGARERALANFVSGSVRALVATDIAARGIDIEEISHVINFDLPNVPETYVHRIGRTGRAGAAGIALSFCDSEERAYLADIERVIGRAVPRVEAHPYKSSVAVGAEPNPAPQKPAHRTASRSPREARQRARRDERSTQRQKEERRSAKQPAQPPKPQGTQAPRPKHEAHPPKRDGAPSQSHSAHPPKRDGASAQRPRGESHPPRNQGGGRPQQQSRGGSHPPRQGGRPQGQRHPSR